MGHIAPECPKRKGAAKEDQLHTNIQEVPEEGYHEVNINQGERKQLCAEKRERGVVNKNWILLDSPKQDRSDCESSSIDIENIRKSNSMVTVHCNTGPTTTANKWDFGNLTSRYNTHSIANAI